VGISEKARHTNPRRAFFEHHAVIEYDGKLYDPSYGTGPFDNLTAWENTSLVGLGLRFSAQNQNGQVIGDESPAFWFRHGNSPTSEDTFLTGGGLQ
jgi:hypothetical protein